MRRAGVIVLDRRGNWAAALARCLPGGIRLRETRSLVECAAALAAAPASLLVLETTEANGPAVMGIIAELGRRFPLARAVVVGDRSLQSREWLLREAGAVHLVTSTRELSGMRHLVCRHAERLPAARASFAQQVWSSLPWGETAES